MTALAKDRPTRRIEGDLVHLPVKGGAKLFAGSLVGHLAGLLVAASETAGIVIVGRNERQVDNSAGEDSDVSADVKRGQFQWANSAGGDAITAADIGKRCFAVDDQTVAKTIGAGLRPCAGIVAGLDDNGVYVQTDIHAMEQRTIRLPYAISETDTLAGTSAELISPVTGGVTLLKNIVQKAVTTGGTVTVKVNGVAVAGLSCVVPDAAAKGSVVSDTPTANDATCKVAVGDRIEIVPDAAFATAGAVSGFLEIAY